MSRRKAAGGARGKDEADEDMGVAAERQPVSRHAAVACADWLMVCGRETDALVIAAAVDDDENKHATGALKLPNATTLAGARAALAMRVEAC